MTTARCVLRPVPPTRRTWHRPATQPSRRCASTHGRDRVLTRWPTRHQAAGGGTAARAGRRSRGDRTWGSYVTPLGQLFTGLASEALLSDRLLVHRDRAAVVAQQDHGDCHSARRSYWCWRPGRGRSRRPQPAGKAARLTVTGRPRPAVAMSPSQSVPKTPTQIEL